MTGRDIFKSRREEDISCGISIQRLVPFGRGSSMSARAEGNSESKWSSLLQPKHHRGLSEND